MNCRRRQLQDVTYSCTHTEEISMLCASGLTDLTRYGLPAITTKMRTALEFVRKCIQCVYMCVSVSLCATCLCLCVSECLVSARLLCTDLLAHLQTQVYVHTQTGAQVSSHKYVHKYTPQCRNLVRSQPIHSRHNHPPR